MVMEVIHPKCRLVPKNSKARLPTLLPDLTCTYFLGTRERERYKTCKLLGYGTIRQVMATALMSCLEAVRSQPCGKTIVL